MFENIFICFLFILTLQLMMFMPKRIKITNTQGRPTGYSLTSLSSDDKYNNVEINEKNKKKIKRFSSLGPG